MTRITRKILVVDDDDFVRGFCTEMLVSAGYEIETAIDGMDAIDKLKTSVYDLVISDIIMPRLDGIGLYACIEKEHAYLKDRFLFITGGIRGDAEPAEIFPWLAGRIIKKPFNIGEFLKIVESIIAVPIAEHLGKEGINRRKEPRYPCVVDCSLLINNGYMLELFAAQTQDVSKSGMRVKYFKQEPLKAEENAGVNMDTFKIQRDGQVQWSKSLSDSAMSGLAFKEHLPISVIIKGL